MNLRKLSLGIMVLLAVICGSALPDGKARAETATLSSGASTYVYYGITLGNNSYQNVQTNLYLPSTNPLPGSYDHPSGNASGSLVTYPYPIKVWWNYSISSCRGTMQSDPWLNINLVGKDGNITKSNQVFYSGADKNENGSFILPANTGMWIQHWSGQWSKWHGGLEQKNHYFGFDANYSISFKPDDVAPGEPGATEVSDTKLVGQIYHINIANKNELAFTWNPATDYGPLFNGERTVSGLGNYAEDPNAYTVYINGQPQESDITKNHGIDFRWDSSGSACRGTINLGRLLSILPELADHPFTFAIGAKDRAGNWGKASPAMTIRFDNFIPSTPGTPTALRGKDGFVSTAATDGAITWDWVASTEDPSGSGIAGYNVIIHSGSPDGPVVRRVYTETNRFVQPETTDGTTYYCAVQAVDGVGISGGYSATGQITVDCSVNPVILPAYPIHWDGTKATASFEWQGVNDLSGIVSYQVALTSSPNLPEGGDPNVAPVGDANGNWSCVFRGLGAGPYYAWVRGVDAVGNLGPWRNTQVFPGFTFNGPADHCVTNLTAIEFTVEPTCLILGKSLGYRVYYQNLTSGYKGNSGSQPLVGKTMVKFPYDGKWQWYLEIEELDADGKPIGASRQISASANLTIDTAAPGGEFEIAASDGKSTYTEDQPTPNRNVLLTNIRLNDDSGIVHSGVAGVTLWNGENATPPADALRIDAAQIIPSAIPWTLPDQDGTHRVNMQVADVAGNTCNFTRTVCLDRTPSAAPEAVKHSFAYTTDSIGKTLVNSVLTWSGSEDVVKFRGAYCLPGGTEIPFTATPSQLKTGSFQLDLTTVAPNQPVTLKLIAIDRAGNESIPTLYTFYTPAQPGKLQYRGGGYDSVGNRHYLQWQLADPGVAQNSYLEYAAQNSSDFAAAGRIIPAGGVLTFDYLQSNDLKLQPHATYYFRLVAVNDGGDPAFGPVFTQTVPNSAPSAPLPTTPQGFVGEHINFHYQESTDPDGDGLQYRIYLGNGSNPEDFQEIGADQSPKLAHGQSYFWYVSADDGCGGVTAGPVMQFTVDSRPPVLEVEAVKRPYSNQTKLVIHAWDDSSKPARLVARRWKEGEPAITEEIPLTSNADGCDGTVLLPEGEYHLQFTLYDGAGNLTQESLNNLKIDQTVPQVSDVRIDCINGGNGYFCNNGRLPLQFTATDATPGSGVSLLRYWITPNPDSGADPGKTRPLPAGINRYAYSLDLDGTDGQSYYLMFAVEDGAGNQSQIQRFGPVRLDRTAPQVALKLTGLTYHDAQFYLTEQSLWQADVTARDDESGIMTTQWALFTADGTILSGWGEWPAVKQTQLTEGGRYRVGVKVTNAAGLETSAMSDEFIFDSTPPQGLTLSGPASVCLPKETVIWHANATDSGSAITEYRLALGTAPGETGVSASIPGNQDGWLVKSGLKAEFRVTLPETASGNYYPTLVVRNAAGLTSVFPGTPITVVPQGERMIVCDQGPYTLSNHSLTGWWNYGGAQTDVKYRFRIIGPGEQPVTDWRETSERMATVDALTLKQGAQYRFEVQAVLGESGYSVSGFSPGITVDTSGPVLQTLVTPAYATSPNLQLTWSATDEESNLSKVEVALGSAYGSTDFTRGWVEITGNTLRLNRDRNGETLSLPTGKPCYLTLRLTNGAGGIFEQVAPAIMIDDTEPPIPVVVDQGDYINMNQPLQVQWIWSTPDPESGIASYQWALLDGTSDPAQATWHKIDGARRVTLDNFHQEQGHVYYFAVKATNGAGLTAIGLSDGVMVDATAAAIPEVTLINAVNLSGDPSQASDVNYVTSNSGLGLWINSHDPESGIISYLYASGNRQTIDQAKEESATEPVIHLADPALAPGEVTLFKGVCVNGAGVRSQTGYSAGVLLDRNAPRVRNVCGTVSGDSLLFDWDVVASGSPVAGYRAALVPQGQSNAIPDETAWVKTGLNCSVKLSGKDLPEGKYVLLVQAWNAAGTYSRRQANLDEWGISPEVTVDRTPPTLDALECPSYASARLNIQVSATDTLSGIAGYQYALGSLADRTVYSRGWVDVDNQAGKIQIPVSTIALPQGCEVYVTVRVKDKTGLWSDIRTGSKVLIDHTTPTIPEVSCGRYTTNPQEIDIRFKSIDPESQVEFCKIGLMTEKNGAWMDARVQAAKDFDGRLTGLNLQEAGSYYIAVQTQNGAGDWSEIGYSETVTVDTTKPVLTFISDHTLVLNRPPLEVKYSLSEAGTVGFTLTRGDGSQTEQIRQEQTAGEHDYIFTQSLPDTYTLTAALNDLAGNAGEVKQQLIRVNAPPQVTLAKEYKTTPGAQVNFSAVALDPDAEPGDILSYRWEIEKANGVKETFTTAAPTCRYGNVVGDYPVVLTVCDKDGGVATTRTLVKVGNTTHNTLYMDETWSGRHQLDGDVIVPEGITLTLAPGTRVLVSGQAGALHELRVKGSLIIQGGEDKRVCFDGGNGGGNGWKGIRIEGRAILDQVEVRGAERGITVMGNAKVEISRSLFAGNLVGIHAFHSAFQVTDCIFENNIYGVKEDSGGAPTLTYCLFSGNTVDYYDERQTRVTIEQLNEMAGNHDNKMSETNRRNR